MTGTICGSEQAPASNYGVPNTYRTQIDLLRSTADRDDLHDLIVLAKENGVGKIAVDTIDRAMNGGDENHPTDMGTLLRNLNLLRYETGAHVMGVHHGTQAEGNRSLSIELGLDRVRVNAILPGPVDGARIRAVIRAKATAAGISENEMTERTVATTSLRCFVTQQDIANMALYLASPFGATISGQAISVDADMQTTM